LQCVADLKVGMVDFVAYLKEVSVWGRRKEREGGGEGGRECVCVKETEEDREKERERQRDRETVDFVAYLKEVCVWGRGREREGGKVGGRECVCVKERER